MEARLFIGLLIGLASYSCLYLGKGIQKYAIEGIKVKKSLKTRHSGIWIAGTILTALPVFIQWAALAYAPVNLIAPLEGVGLIVLLVFSALVLKEAVTRLDLAGAGMIVGGLVVIALFNRNTGKIAREDFSLPVFFIALAGLAALETAAILWSRSSTYRYGGLVIGLTAGTMMAFQTLSKRISVIPDYRLLGAVGVFVFAPLTLVITQFGFAKAQASRVVPAFTVASILVAMVVGKAGLSERIVVFQWPGIGLLVAGIILMTGREKEKGDMRTKV